MPLFDLLQKKNQIDEEKKIHEEQRQAKERAEKELQILFKNVPKQEIQLLLEKNYGDMHKTMDELLERNNTEETRKKEIVSSLMAKLHTTESRTRFVLEQNNWDSEKATNILTTEEIKKKFETYVALYIDIDPKEISAQLCLDDNLIMQKLNIIREKKAS